MDQLEKNNKEQMTSFKEIPSKITDYLSFGACVLSIT